MLVSSLTVSGLTLDYAQWPWQLSITYSQKAREKVTEVTV